MLLKIGSVRYSAFYFVPFYGAVEAAGAGRLEWMLGGAVLCLVFCMAIELLNRFTDQRWDRINNPKRTRMCEEIGFLDIGILSAILFAILVPAGFLWLALTWNFELFLIHTVVWALAWNYSFGLRLKRRRYASLLALSATFVLPFLVGWVMSKPVREIPLVLAFVPVFILTLAGSKDLTDVEGDRTYGYRSLFIDALRARLGRFVLSLTSFVLLGAMLALNLAPLRYAALLVFLPGAWWIVRWGAVSRTPEERATTREATYHLWFGVLVAAMALTTPTPRCLVAMACATAFWFVATQRLHWSGGITRESLRVALVLTRRSI